MQGVGVLVTISSANPVHAIKKKPTHRRLFSWAVPALFRSDALVPSSIEGRLHRALSECTGKALDIAIVHRTVQRLRSHRVLIDRHAGDAIRTVRIRKSCDRRLPDIRPVWLRRGSR